VTLYGLIDAGITYTNNQGGSKNVQATSGAGERQPLGPARL
jgi:GBP family porin